MAKQISTEEVNGCSEVAKGAREGPPSPQAPYFRLPTHPVNSLVCAILGGARNTLRHDQCLRILTQLEAMWVAARLLALFVKVRRADRATSALGLGVLLPYNDWRIVSPLSDHPST